MKKQIHIFIGIILIITAGLVLQARAQGAPAQNLAIGTAFSYQGVLTDNGEPANGAYDLEFALFDAANGGNQIGTTFTVGNHEVNDGLLLVQLDFGQNVFTGSPRYLEIWVNGELLTDRQPLTASPYAIHAGSATALTDADGNAVVQVEAGGNVGVGLDNPAANVHILGNLSQPLTGTVTVGANSANVVGVDTLFTQELVAGDAILIGTERFTVQTILSDIDLTLDRPHPTGALNEVAYADSDLLVVQNGDGVTTLAMDKSGNLGIGTAVPGAALHLYGDGTTLYGPNSGWGGYLQIGGSGYSPDRASISTSDGTLYLDDKDGGSGTFINYYSHNNTLINAQGGRVGIGTVSPTELLDIAGNVRIQGNLLVTGSSTTGPHFITPVTVATGTGTAPWTTFDASAYIPTNATAVILEAEGNSSVNADTYIRIRRDSSSPNYLLLKGQPHNSEGVVAWGSQGTFPTLNRSFQFTVSGGGFNTSYSIRLVGYFN